MDYISNLLSAFILFFTIFFYVVVYTVWLKRRTPQNIVIGGAAGALPPVIGWTIVTGNLSLEAISFFLIIFFWTPSHFWALSLYKAEDYRLANIPMLPVISGVQNTKINILFYSLIMLPVLYLPYHIGFVGNFFAIFCLPLTIYYNYICFDLYKDEKHKFNILKAKKVFSYSIIYLFAIFVLFLVDNFV
jgi:protoheme IX farnesyltransferase